MTRKNKLLAIPALFLTVLITSIIFAPTIQAGQGFYSIDQSTRNGMLVSLTKNPGVIEPSSDKNSGSLVGVIGTSQADFDIQDGQIAVQSEGTVQTLVSTVEGDIKVGDRVGPSSLIGLGAKVQNNGWVVGIAQGSLDAGSNNGVKSVVKDSSGGEKEVVVGSIPVLVKVMYFNGEDKDGSERNRFMPPAFQDLVDTIAGKRASLLATVLAFLIIIAGLIVCGVVVNASVKNGILSTGRQPLAKKSIMRQMMRSFLFTGLLLVATLISAFVILRIL